MFIQQKPFLRNIKRVRVSEGRKLDIGLRLDRNEKVDVWPPEFLSKIFAAKPDYLLSIYPENDSLYRKLSQFLNVTEDQLMLTSGIDGGLKTLFEIITAPGDLVGVLSPTYAMYKVYANLFQVHLTEIGYASDFSIKYSDLEQFLLQRPAILFVPNPNQPIESALTISELEVLAQRTNQQNCLLVIDEAYHMFGCDTGLPLLKKFNNVVVLRTFSKGFGVPSIRLGYMISNSNNMQVLSKTRLAHESNALSNTVAEYLLDHYDLVESYIHQVISGRDYIKCELAKLELKVHGKVGNYLLVDLHTPIFAEKVVSYLRDRAIYVKGPWPPPWDKYITITVGPIHLMERFVITLQTAITTFSK